MPIAPRPSNITIQSDAGPVPHSVFNFSCGEVQVRLLPCPALDDNPSSITSISFIITAHLRNSDDIMELLLLNDALRHKYKGVRKTISLICPYWPYARQDRVCAPGEANGLSVFNDLINEAAFNYIETWDFHNPNMQPWLIETNRLFPEKLIGKPNDIVVAPDKGGVARAQHYARTHALDVLYCDKLRHPADGTILKSIAYVTDQFPIADRDFLIIDDILDGGRTFIELAKVLRPHTKGKIKLFVTHGIFSAGYDELASVIDEIYVANFFPPSNTAPSFIHILKVTP